MKKICENIIEEEMNMNEECLLKYLLNPDELEKLTEILENITKEVVKSE